jgi:hypothetical protein
MEAVEKVNAGLVSGGSRQRVRFAQIPFLAEHSFAARDSHLWGFNASTLRKLLALLTWGKVSLHANDEVRSQRSSVCQDFFKRVKGETDDQKRARKDRLIGCQVAAIAHPNRKGAALYAEAIKEQLRVVISNPGWVRINAATSPAMR